MSVNTWFSYEKFFNDVYSKKDGIDVSIVMPSLLLSEVLNRLMNDIYYCEFLRSNPIPAGMKKNEHHKHVYRCSEQYALDLAAATSSIRGYHQNVQFLDDQLNSYSFKTLLKNIPIHLDFNDHMYCMLAKKYNLTIVTNDGDFYKEDIPILTTLPGLLKLGQIKAV